ncbi:MAG: alpha/beta fold hydrolase [Gammaproteobacteria bacterium]|nr:alpha/beta fold hydrolase [Gammaproteobacteria bacterium]
MWFKSLTRATRTLLQVVSIGLIGCLVAVVIVFVYVLDSRPDLSIWHLADLDEEFTAKSDVSDFSQYLALEERLFEQLDALVYTKVPEGPENIINRYSSGSLSDPGRWPVNWNRTFELRQKQPRAGVLLLHGLSDSPYSMRALAQLLHDQGAWVIGLRIPGHGTAPSGLVETRWQDMAAAVRLAARHVRDAVGDKPFYLVGYSNGGALSMEYTLSTLDDTSLPRPSGVILLSPEIGVSAVAALAVWQGRLGHLLGLEKLAWNGLLPEYDPYKYGSFAVNAGDLAHRITVHIQEQLDALQGSGKLEKMPPILAFQSSVDATVTAPALVANLFARLPPANHELVLFDINRNVKAALLVKQDPRKVFKPLLDKSDRSYDLTVVTNEDPESNRVVVRTRAHGKEDYSAPVKLGEWPPGIYSLSHVALPFSPRDPVYGGPSAGKSPGIQLGNLALRGERGVLYVSGTELMRLRWNPFFDYVQSRVLQFTQLSHQ